MSLRAGDHIGCHEILDLLGRGGMGEVYRARDTKLKRDVALKVLPDAFADDPGRMARFRREAEILASLNHPNIAAIYGLEDRALVMELVEGESPKGPMPFEDAWRIASQIAAALEYAHGKGVIHRDLKPANVKITPEGQVKLLDFGLAKAFSEPSAAPASDAMNSPTLTMGATQVGVILGTAGYMAPEQAKGKSVDKRADIWAFGVLLYELLTGQRPFQGEDVSEILASVIKDQPPWDAVDVRARRLLRKCMAKDSKDRLRDIGDAPALLDEAAPTPELRPGVREARLPWIVAALATIAAIALGYVSYHRAAEEPPRAVTVSLLPPDQTEFARYSIPAISPDGRRVAFVAGSEKVPGQLWIRDLDTLTSRPLQGTNGARYPFWSPDGKFIGFFANGKLERIDVEGAPAIILADAASPLGGTWSKNNVILFRTDNTGLLRVSADGGEPAPATHADPGSRETSHAFPWFLPDGRHFLYTAQTSSVGGTTSVYLADIDSKDVSRSRRKVLTAFSNVVYSSGYLLFVLERTLMAQRFDVDKAQTIGDPVPIATQLDYRPGGTDAVFSASQNGTLVYAAGYPGTEVQLTWFDQSGKPAGTLGNPVSQLWPEISPDASAAVVDRRDNPRTGFFELWLYDLKRGNSSRLTFNSDSYNNYSAAWSPDGSHIAFSSSRTGENYVYQKAISGTEADELLDGDSLQRRPTDWSHDGRYIVEEVSDPKTKNDIWILPRSGDRKSFPYLQTEFDESHGKLSPNGLWLAYASNETQRSEIYVQSFPKPGNKRKISTNGGYLPVWSRDGKELFFFDRNLRTLMAVAVNSGPTFEAGAPHALLDARQAGTGSWYDVGKDGRFLIPVQPDDPTTRSITVVLNWQAALKK